MTKKSRVVVEWILERRTDTGVFGREGDTKEGGDPALTLMRTASMQEAAGRLHVGSAVDVEGT